MVLKVDERTVAMVAVCEAAIAFVEAERAVDRWGWDGLSMTEDMIAEEAPMVEAYGRLCDAVGRLLPIVTVPANGEAT